MNQVNIKFAEFSAVLRSNPDTPVIFYFDNIAINPGYHVTEVKHEQVTSLDCGRGSDQWEELVIQLMDGQVGSRESHMESSKLFGIIGAALNPAEEKVGLQVFFEYSPDNGSLCKLAVESVNSSQNQISVTLRSLQAVCKPMQRIVSAFDAGIAAVQTCCGRDAQKDASACCR